MLLHLRLVLHLALIFITFAVGITFAVVIAFSGDTDVVLKVSARSHGYNNRQKKSTNKLFVGNSITSSKLGKQTVSILKKTLREFDSRKDCLEQVRNDVKMANEKLSALYKFKIDSAENKRKRKSEA